MAFPDGFVEDVRRAADIVRVISEHVALKKMGTSWKGLCPFHQEKTPSFNVRAEPAVFHCFGCGEGGDVFKFVMLREKASFPEAIEMLARRFGVPVPEGRAEPGPDRREREEMLALMEAAAQHFTHTFWAAPGTKAREYLLGRGFRRETLERVRAGAARDAWDDLLSALRGKFAPPLLSKAGLVLERQGKEGHYDRFRNRAVFPILNESGKVVAFGARALDGSEPKYLNSPETPVYSKSRVLYGLSWAREAIGREKRAVLMEGYLDVARAIEAGVGEAVATCGTALTASHARLLRRFAETVVLNFDQDDAGQKAARRSLEVLLEEGMRVRIVELPDGHDPDTYLKAEGAEAYRKRLDEAPEAVEWLMRRAEAAGDLQSPAGKAAFFAAVLPALVRTGNAVERQAWLGRVVERGSLDAGGAREELRRALHGRTSGPSAVAEAAARRPVAARAAVLLPAERWLLALVAQGAAGVEIALDELQEPDLEGLRSAPLLRAAQAVARRDERVTLAAVVAGLDEDAQRMMSEIAVEGVPAEHLSAEECVRELRRQPLRARMAEIQKRLAGASGDAQEALLAEKTRLVRQMASL
ncbi:MAG TPA: DNA primase [Vicinamibacteria bacterium]|nr:DNA primase [Vicinamibacteria bacterium]